MKPWVLWLFVLLGGGLTTKSWTDNPVDRLGIGIGVVQFTLLLFYLAKPYFNDRTSAGLSDK